MHTECKIMKNTKIYLLTLAAVVLAGCSEIPKEAYNRPITPETLLDRSLERVTLNLSSKESLDTLTNWVERKAPGRAEVSCSASSKLCGSARKVLKSYGVEVVDSSSADSDIVLIYDKIAARDCDSSYMDMPINPYNFNAPHFGCAVSANTIRMVSDRSQFYSPAMTGTPDASRAVKTYDHYRDSPQEDMETEILVGSGGS